MEITEIAKLKLKLLDQVRAAILDFEHAVDGEPVELEGLVYSKEFRGGAIVRDIQPDIQIYF